jgi:quinol monooxygenase YgiN
MMQGMSVIALAELFGTAGARTELLEILGDAQRSARERPGCMRYAFAQAIDDADHFILVSEWEDQSRLDAHYASPEFTRFQLSLHGLLARPSEMTVYSISTAARPLPPTPMDPRDAD